MYKRLSHSTIARNSNAFKCFNGNALALPGERGLVGLDSLKASRCVIQSRHYAVMAASLFSILPRGRALFAAERRIPLSIGSA